jgi:hypothetical protein
MVKSKELIRELICDKNITDIKQLEKETGLSRNRIYEIKKSLGLGTRSVVIQANYPILPQTPTTSPTNSDTQPHTNTPESEAFVPTHNGYIKRQIANTKPTSLITVCRACGSPGMCNCNKRDSIDICFACYKNGKRVI